MSHQVEFVITWKIYESTDIMREWDLYLGSLEDLHPGQEGEHEEEEDSEHLPAAQHLLGLLTELEVHQKYCHGSS